MKQYDFDITDPIDPRKYYDEECITLYYYPDENIFKDGKGDVVVNIHRYVAPADLLLFHYHQANYIAKNEFGLFVELMYPDM